MKQEKAKLKDESGDKKYFTQIPNIIVNHSTAYEQSLYLIMKRVAGEDGSCFKSLNNLAKMMGIHRNTLTQTIKKLLKRNWVKEIEPVKVRGGEVRQFVVVDIWPQNIKEYESASQVPTSESASQITESASQNDTGASQMDTKKNLEEEHIKKITISNASVAGKEINLLIELFKPINPSYKRLYANTTQRACLDRLIKENNREDIEEAIKILPKTNTMQFAPVITTPQQLENKIGLLKVFIIKEGLKINQNKIIKL